MLSSTWALSITVLSRTSRKVGRTSNTNVTSAWAVWESWHRQIHSGKRNVIFSGTDRIHLQNISCEITEPAQTSLMPTKKFVVPKHHHHTHKYGKSTQTPHQLFKLMVEIGHGQNCCLEKAFLGCKEKEHPRTSGSLEENNVLYFQLDSPSILW